MARLSWVPVGLLSVRRAQPLGKGKGRATSRFIRYQQGAGPIALVPALLDHGADTASSACDDMFDDMFDDMPPLPPPTSPPPRGGGEMGNPEIPPPPTPIIPPKWW